MFYDRIVNLRNALQITSNDTKGVKMFKKFLKTIDLSQYLGSFRRQYWTAAIPTVASIYCVMCVFIFLNFY